MKPIQVEIGRRFGKAVVIETGFSLARNSAVKCRCDCGKEFLARSARLLKGTTQGCNSDTCYHSRTHGASHGELELTYNSWKSLLARCTNPNHNSYARYGGSGITLCAEWHSFEKFLEDLGPRTSRELSLDRIDNSKGYFKENCRWADKTIQSRNRSVSNSVTYQGKTLRVSEWAEIVKLPPQVIYQRLENGWSAEDALTLPKKIQKSPHTHNGPPTTSNQIPLEMPTGDLRAGGP